PIIAAFAVSLLHFIAAYRLRVAVSVGQMIGAVFAAMSLQWTVARAVGIGICKSSLPFMRTAKGGATRKGPDFPAFWEGILGALLLISAVLLFATNYKQIREINIFAFVLGLQSLPFVSAVGIATLEGLHVTDLGFCRGPEGRVRAFVRQRPPFAEPSANLPATENRIETVP